MQDENVFDIEGLESGLLQQSQMKRFHEDVYEIVKNAHITILEAIAVYCSERDMEVEEAVPLISQQMKSEITDQAIEFNQLRRDSVPSQLEFD